MSDLIQQILNSLSSVVDFFQMALEFVLTPFRLIDIVLTYIVELAVFVFAPLSFVPPAISAVFIFMVIFGFILFVLSLIVGLLL